jgi:queuine/archaeosine tRNA-ribosyltransferase
MGDCGAFSYVREERPPYSVEQVVNFYDELGFDYGISVDHVILGFDPRVDEQSAPKEWRRRQEITLELASDFLKEHKRRGSRFTPLGVAQGWSPASYAYSVEQLQKVGFSYIAMGGMVPLKTIEISACLERVNRSRHMNTRLHLLGVTRCEQVREFARFGAVSFDSTSPLRQAFKDSKDNYWTLDRTYSAIRVPQVQANPALLRKILAGKVNQAKARRLEQECLKALLLFDAGKASVDYTLMPLVEYERLCDDGPTRAETYRETLLESPWKSCDCDICKRIGIHVILFRGAERNRRRGFHNIYVFHQRLHREMDEEREAECLALSPGGIG